MRQIRRFSLHEIQPEPSGVFQLQGVPGGVQPSPRVKALYQAAEKLFFQLAAPLAVFQDISFEAFSQVYQGRNLNEPDTPLPHIFPLAQRLVLFAFTLGPAVSIEIDRLSKGSGEPNGLALGFMLDAIASFCTEKAGTVAQEILLDEMKSKEPPGNQADCTRALLYSPGYCGWHVSGQELLFSYLKPEEIGIVLNESFLMIPLKSISGVLVAGEANIHHFKNNYPFCRHCPTQTCRQRIESLKRPYP